MTSETKEKKPEKEKPAKHVEKTEKPKEEPALKEQPATAHKEASKESAPAVPAAAAQPPVQAPPAPVEPPRRAKPRIAIVHVYSSKNDTIITATDQSGAETLAWASGGMMVKSDREEGKPYAAMQAAIKVVGTLKNKGINTLHIRIRAPGGSGSKSPGAGAQAVVRAMARSGVRIGRIDDVTPVPTDSMKRKGGRRGRRV